MISSQEVASLGAALSKAQGEMGNAKKGQINPFFKSTYADLASVWDVCREPLSNNELSIIQAIDVKEGEQILLRTVLLHSSGQWVASNYPVNPVKLDPQGIGSAITYARRYSLMAMIGIAPEDDDGEMATGRGSEKAKLRPSPRIASEAQIRKIHIDAKNAGLSDDDYKALLNDNFNVTSSKDLSSEQASSLIDIIKNIKGELVVVKPTTTAVKKTASKTTTPAPESEQASTPADLKIKNLGELFTACKERYDMTPSQVVKELGISDKSEIGDPQEAWEAIKEVKRN